MGAPAWGTRVAAGVAAVLVIGVGAALALPVVTGGGSPSVSVDEVPDTSHAALVQEYEQKVAERKAAMAAAKEHQASLQKDTQEAKAAEEEAKAAQEKAEQEKAEADAKAQAEKEAKAEADAKAEEDAAAKAKDDSARDATDSKESTDTKDKGTEDKPATPDWWPEHVWAHATSCTVDGQSVVGTWDVWVKYGGDWTVVSASDDPAEVSGTDGDKVKIVYTDRTATLHKQHDDMAKYLGGPVHITVANAADSSQTHTFKVDLWVVAKDDGTCPA